MGHRLVVQVIDWRGDPVKDVKVCVDVDGWMTGGGLEPSYTDSNGHAYFETEGDYEPTRQVRISCKGSYLGPYDISGGSFTVQV